jgi:hypothetical protein
MALKATEDTYAFEQVGPDTFVRREIKAGHAVPPGLFADEEGTQEFQTQETPEDQGAPMYKHQYADDGSVAEEHQSKVAPYEPPLKEGEVVTGQEQVPTQQVELQQTGDKSELPEPQSKKPTQQPEVRREK